MYIFAICSSLVKFFLRINPLAYANKTHWNVFLQRLFFLLRQDASEKLQKIQLFDHHLDRLAVNTERKCQWPFAPCGEPGL
jgi:hypothetical protein